MSNGKAMNDRSSFRMFHFLFPPSVLILRQFDSVQPKKKISLRHILTSSSVPSSTSEGCNHSKTFPH